MENKRGRGGEDKAAEGGKRVKKGLPDGEKHRCFPNKPGNPLYERYHDEEWGVPVHDDQLHFEMLILEGAQAGLSWETVLKKREGYREAFKGFDPVLVAAMTDEELEAQVSNAGIVRHRGKIFSTRLNAQAFLEIQTEFGSFDSYVWRFVDGKPKLNDWSDMAQMPAKTKESEALSKDLKKRGMKFVGPTIVYAYMQAVGLVNDHVQKCWCYQRR
ncbi:unnamed protein product [Chrysoparadoxa australica]